MRAIITLISPLLMGMITLLTGQADPDPARFAKSPDGDEVYIESFEYWDEKNSVPDDAVLFVGGQFQHTEVAYIQVFPFCAGD